ncbi:MAG TPA: phospholipase D-like domain-containing protein [Gemmatimonadaceae bacterium]|jgi:phosphatidylserine/phosphatidylglycerophosphate/cardiolipin synthase-like enzyme
MPPNTSWTALGARPHNRLALFTWRRLVTTLGLLVAALFAASSVRRSGAALSGVTLTIRPLALAATTALEVLLLAWNIYLWSRIVALFDAPAPALADLVRIWRRSTLAKYLPGSIWSAAVTAEMAQRSGGSPIALTASFLIQATLTLTAAVTVGALFGARSSIATAPVAATIFAGALLLVRPQSINATIRLVSVRRNVTPPRWTGTWLAGAVILVLHVVTWIAFGVTFAALLRALTPAPGTDWMTIAAINAVAFASGFLAFFAPGGIGVRESILVVLLAPIVPALGTRIAVAAASRLWLVATEGVTAGLSFAITKRRRSRARVGEGAWLPAAPSAVMIDIRSATRAAYAEVLTDSRRALASIVSLCATARYSIAISQLAFDADCIPIAAPGALAQLSLLETLIDAARRGVKVRVVLNGGLLLDTMPALRRAIDERGAAGVLQLRSIKAFPQMMHAKMIVIDDADAFLMGASFVNGYWDSATHSAAGNASAPPGATARPLHDVSVHLAGPVVRDLARCFDDLWCAAEMKPDPAGVQPRLPAADVAMAAPASNTVAQILRTSPDRLSTRGQTEILDAYLKAIEGARSFIYLESQYFSARPIAAAVRSALDATASLEAIIVINQNPDITAYRGWQDARLREHGLLDHPRAGVFALWSTTPSMKADRIELTQTFIHSKVGIVDDRWATIGSANLDGASLHSYGDDFESLIGRRTFERFRNYDINVALHKLGDDGDCDVVTEARRALWLRHLGQGAVAEQRPADGWLAVWRAAAASNVAALRDGRTMPGRALPYVPTARPRRQLAALGVDVSAGNLDLRFDPGRTEVILSAGWMKRLLPERWRPS